MNNEIYNGIITREMEMYDRPLDMSIVIVNYNTIQLLKDCLDSIFNTKNKLTLEVIVVDNGSIDGSVEMCERDFQGIHLIKNIQNKGFSEANNQGILASSSDLIMLLNSDTIVFPGSFEKMIDQIMTNSSIGVLGCRLISLDGSLQPSCLRFPSFMTVLTERLLLYKLSLRFPRTEMEPPFLDSQKECDWIYGACMLIRKKALMAAGLFDSNIWMYGEELELCYRIKLKGWRIVVNLDAKVIHFGGASWKNKEVSQTFPKMIGTLYYYKKHFSIITYIALKFIYMFGAIIRIIVWTILYMVKKKERSGIQLEIKSNLAFLLFCINLRTHFSN